jgi:hypothetical protein
MASTFNETHTDHESHEGYSSSGMPTQRFVPTLQEQPLVTNQRNTAVALMLLFVGLLMLVGRITGAVDPALSPVSPDGGSTFVPGMILLTIAGCFLFFAFWRRWYGPLIPGCLLVGLSMGITLMSIIGPPAVLWGLALGFLAILPLGRRLFNVHSSWPIYPAVPLFGIGMITAIVQGERFFNAASNLLWLPLVLVGVGLYLIGGKRTTA